MNLAVACCIRYTFIKHLENVMTVVESKVVMVEVMSHLTV